MGRICFFPNCVPKNRDFVVFPFRRTPEFESWWIRSGWDQLFSTTKLPDKILICEGHFDESLINRRYKVPRLALGALPSRNIERPPAKIKPRNKPVYRDIDLHRSFCRLCGEMQTELLDEDVPLLKNLDDILQHLQLSEDTFLPMGVCPGCREKATLVQQFWKDFSDAQENIHAIFNQDNTVELLTEIPADSPVQEVIIGPEDEDDNFQSDMFEILPKDEGEFQDNDTELLSEVPDSSKDMESSIDTKTDADNAIICEICGKLFRSRTAIATHLKSHSSEREHTCGTCGKKFRQRRVLLEHVQSKHENKIFPCELCGEIYRWQKGLDRHIKIHKGTYLKHSCTFCDKIYPHPHQLRRHMMLHTGDRIFCDICGKGYRFNYMLTQHKIREHNMEFEGVKLYSKRFPRRKTISKKNSDEQSEQEYVVEFKNEEAIEIVELDSREFDINPVDGSEIIKME